MNHPHTLKFETIAGLGPGGGGAPPPPEEPPAAEPPVEEWSGPSQEEWEQSQAALQQAQQQLGQYEQIFNPPMPQGFEPTRFDPYGSDDPDTQLRQVIREEMAPFANYAEQYELSQTEEQARDIISAIASERGHDLQDGVGDLIIAQSAAYAPAVAAQYGSGPQALEAAIQAAYDDVYGALNSYAQSQQTQEQNHLTTLSQAPREPGPGAPAVQQVTTAPGGFEGVIRKWTDLSAASGGQ